MTTTKIKLNGLDHFALNVKDMKRAENFYTQVLGFPVIHRTETNAGLKHIEVDAGNVAIALFENPDFKQGQGKNAGGFGQYFLIFVVGMLGLSFIVEKGINWDRKDTFYI